MPVTGDEGTLRSHVTPVKLAIAVWADYTRTLCRLAFAADGAVAAPTLGVADAVGVVNADRWTLPVIHIVGKVLHCLSKDFRAGFSEDFSRIFRLSTCRFAIAAGSAAEEARAYPQAGQTAVSTAHHRQNHPHGMRGRYSRGSECYR